MSQDPNLTPPPLPKTVLSYQQVGAPAVSNGAPQGVWAQGKKIVLFKGSFLPNRCVKCNSAECAKVWDKKLTYVNPWAYFAIGIFSLALRKTVQVQACLCETHAAKRKRNIWITVALFLLFPIGFGGGIAIMANAGNNNDAAIISGLILLVVGFISLLVAAFFMSYAVAPVRASKIDDHYAWLVGAGPEYLASLEQIP